MSAAARHTETRPHVPVLLAEVIDVLAPREGGVYVDGTYGAGGYSAAILETGRCRVIGLDRDPDAIEAGRSLQSAHGARLDLVCARFSQMELHLADLAIAAVDGVALDLGVSSMQLDQPSRGFSFSSDGPLDMRMDKTGLSAADVVNRFGERDLADIFYRLGEERRSRAIAKAIVTRRLEQPFRRTEDLADLVAKVIGPKARRHKIHPATRTFQALRLFVNDELAELVDGLGAAERLLKPGGRLAVVTFHSLEDRIVKRFFRQRQTPAARPSRHQPAVEDRGPAPSFRKIENGDVTPGAAEIEANARARSARLRAGERTPAPAMACDPSALGVPELSKLGAMS